MRNGDRDLFVGDQVFELQFGGFVENLRTALVAVVLADGLELLDDDRAQLLFRSKNRLVLSDVVADLGQFLEQLVNGELGEIWR
jgi:hypothetical protein